MLHGHDGGAWMARTSFLEMSRVGWTDLKRGSFGDWYVGRECWFISHATGARGTWPNVIIGRIIIRSLLIEGWID